VQIRNAVVVADDEISTDRVSIGTTVRVFDEDMDEEVEYAIVGAAEADPFNNKISDECPVGAALIGASIGETVTVETPDGEMKFKVLGIAR